MSPSLGAFGLGLNRSLLNKIHFALDTTDEDDDDEDDYEYEDDDGD